MCTFACRCLCDLLPTRAGSGQPRICDKDTHRPSYQALRLFEVTPDVGPFLDWTDTLKNT
jgi:hypothetical protein